MFDWNLLRFSFWRLSVHECASEADTMAAIARNVWSEVGAGTDRGFGMSVGGQEASEGLQDAI